LVATFHDVIRGAVPQIVDLLKESDWQIRNAGANAIGKLAEHCK
jgi:HEAT repeat protein